jgi:hypothetical protein
MGSCISRPRMVIPVHARDSRGSRPVAPEAAGMWTRKRAALAAFVVCLAVGGALILFHLGRYRWFCCDEWEFLAQRQAGNIRDLFRPHGGHWVTLPVLAYRIMWSAFGFNYLGYQAVLLAFHVATVAMLRAVMRRAGVGPWVATVSAVGLILFGAGEDNIVWAFQIALVGALDFGLAQLLLLDHEGPLGRRDWLGLCAGGLALACSGVGITMAVVAGAAALVLRGAWIALFHTLPLLAAYATWAIVERPDFAVTTVETSTSAPDLVRWELAGIRGALDAYGYFTGVGGMLAVLLAGGLVLAHWTRPAGRPRWRMAVPGAMAIGALIFLTMTGRTRAAFGTDQAASSRYVYVVMALLLPALAVAADACLERWRRSAVLILALLVVGIPGNASRFGGHFPWVEGFFRSQRRLISALPRAPEAAQVDRNVQPDPLYASGVTVGWLREQLLAGRLPEPSEPTDPVYANGLRLRLAVAQSSDPEPRDCDVVTTGPIDIPTRKGQVIGFRGRPMTVELLADDGEPLAGARQVFNPDIGRRLTMQLDGLTLRLTPATPTATLRFGPALDVPLAVCR